MLVAVVVAVIVGVFVACGVAVFVGVADGVEPSVGVADGVFVGTSPLGLHDCGAVPIVTHGAPFAEVGHVGPVTDEHTQYPAGE